MATTVSDKGEIDQLAKAATKQASNIANQKIEIGNLNTCYA